MPELPEVERAARLIRSIASGKTIEKVETIEDTIVFSGSSHNEFAGAIVGRKVKNAGRYGKYFYLELDGTGKVPVMHFGMTGMLQVKGESPVRYRESGSQKTASKEWPPRFMKFILHFSDTSGTTTQLAFLDPRRLGRVRLCESPLAEPPITELGFDPILCMPALKDFELLAKKSRRPVKALLLDQSFSAGVGNWLADEILYHARIHPEQPCNTLSETQVVALHHQIADVCRVAVSVNADDSKFPDNWLFKHRWGKGKKAKSRMTLPSGEPATIKWIQVGGRTSAYIVELQCLSTKKTRQPKEDKEESDLTDLTDTDGPSALASQKRKGRGNSLRTGKVERKAGSSSKKARIG